MAGAVIPIDHVPGGRFVWGSIVPTNQNVSFRTTCPLRRKNSLPFPSTVIGGRLSNTRVDKSVLPPNCAES